MPPEFRPLLTPPRHGGRLWFKMNLTPQALNMSRESLHHLMTPTFVKVVDPKP
jgi:hypothetical protein